MSLGRSRELVHFRGMAYTSPRQVCPSTGHNGLSVALTLRFVRVVFDGVIRGRVCAEEFLWISDFGIPLEVRIDPFIPGNPRSRVDHLDLGPDRQLGLRVYPHARGRVPCPQAVFHRLASVKVCPRSKRVRVGLKLPKCVEEAAILAEKAHRWDVVRLRPRDAGEDGFLFRGPPPPPS